MKYVIFGIIGLAAILVLILVAAVIYSNLTRSSGRRVRNLKELMPSQKRKAEAGRVWMKFYFAYDRLPFLGRIQQNYRIRLNSIYSTDERFVRSKAGKDLTMAILVALAFTLFAVLVSTSVESMLVTIVAGVYLGSIVFDFFIQKLERKVLEEHELSMGFLKDAYNATRMVRESLEEAAKESPPMSASHLRQIAYVLEKNSDDEVHDYYSVAPNDYMKRLASVGRNIIKFGEPEGETRPTFVDSVAKITEEIQMEILTRQKLSAKTAGYKFMSMSPILLVEPLKAWALTQMEDVAKFFDTSMSVYVTVFIYVSILVCFIGSDMVQSYSIGSRTTKLEGRFLKWLLKKSLFVRRMMDRIAPMHKETLQSVKVMRKAEPLIKSSNSTLTVRELYLRKCLMVLSAFVIAIVVQIGSAKLNQSLILDLNADRAPEQTTTEYLSKERRLMESQILQSYKDRGVSDEDFVRAVQENKNFNRYAEMDENAELYAEKLLKRLRDAQKPIFDWIDLVVAIAVSAVAWFLPNILLYFRAMLRKQNMQLEVDGFYVDIMILAKNDRIMVYEILEAMHRYSSIFEPQLLRCLMSYEKGAIVALDKLKEEVNFPPMERIVERLKRAVDRVTVREAFEDLESARSFSLEQRKIMNDKMIETRTTLAENFGRAPIIILAVGYLLLPWGLAMLGLGQDMLPVLEQFLGGGE